MKHKVLNVEELYHDSKELLKNVNGGLDASADTIIKNLNEAIINLKNNWEGADAGVQIQKVVVAYNAMTDIANALANLSVDSSVVASNYREIQIINQAKFNQLSPLTFTEFQKQSDYVDNRDTININDDANIGKAKIDAANKEIVVFIETIKRLYNKIMDNWQVGTGRDKAANAFNDFLKNSNKYRDSLYEVSENITSALKNYVF